jgi:integrase
MQNLLSNRHNTFIYRKQINNTDIRISLRTKDRLEAHRLVSEINSLVEYSQLSDSNQIRKIVFATLAKLQPTLKAERLSRLSQLLGFSLEQDEGELLSVVINKYVDEKLRTKSWTEKTYESYQSIFAMLPQLIADKGIRSVNSKDAQYVKTTLQRLPSSMGKRADYRGKTLKQILNMQIPTEHLMALKTINTRLSCYSELFKWASRNSYVETNVFFGLVLKDNRVARDLRLPFTPADLNDIFSASAISDPRKPWHYWLPVLALYTGARLNELCQLEVTDIQLTDGVWLLDITDRGHNQNLKSASSRRKIPLHKDLIELGFIRHVQQVKQAGSNTVFNLSMRNSRYSHAPSKWFNIVKSRALQNPDRKAFHSFRHTFIDYAFNKLKMQGNPLLKAIVGHSDSEITSGVYGSSFELQDLNDVIQKIDFKQYGVFVPKL